MRTFSAILAPVLMVFGTIAALAAYSAHAEGGDWQWPMSRALMYFLLVLIVLIVARGMDREVEK